MGKSWPPGKLTERPGHWLPVSVCGYGWKGPRAKGTIARKQAGRAAAEQRQDGSGGPRGEIFLDGEGQGGCEEESALGVSDGLLSSRANVRG